MTFAELKAELLARGFNPVGDTRAGLMVNAACQELDQVALWPYREKSATGVAPLTVTDLGTIEAVTNETTHVPLAPAEFRQIVTYGDAGLGGAPQFYYVAWPNGVPVVATYPTNGDTIGVQYYRVTPELSDPADTPLAPSRFHEIIVDMAVRRGYLDTDNYDAARGVQMEIDRKVSMMVNQLFGQSVQGPLVVQDVSGASCDW